MIEQQAYSFTILRYIHDIISGEFLNVGVVVYSPDSRELVVRTQSSIGRVRAAFPDMDLHIFRNMVKSIESGIARLAEEIADTPQDDGEDRDARNHGRSVLPDDDSSLQWGPVGFGITTDVSSTLDRLFARYVTKHDGPARHERSKRTDADVRRRFHEQLSQQGVDIPFRPKRVRGTEDEITFRSAWKNGNWHAVEPVSLDLANERGIKNKARLWRGHLDAVAEAAREEVSVHFVVARPSDAGLSRAFDSAKVILAGSPFSEDVVEEARAEALIATIREHAVTMASRENQDATSPEEP